MKVLLLEPNRMLAQQYMRFLEKEAYEVVWCENAQDGIAVADEQHPDLVLVELLLAGHSGIEFLYEYRSYADWLNVPVLILSGVSQVRSGVKGSILDELGVDAYLYKPETSLEQLGKQVRRSLDQAASKAHESA